MAGKAQRAGTILVWLITVFELVTMGMAGWGKLGAAAGTWQGLFAGWGYPSGFSTVVGVVELLGVAALMVPALASWAAIWLGAVMIGALATVLTHPGPLGPITPVVHLLLLGIIGYARWNRRLGRSGEAEEAASRSGP